MFRSKTGTSDMPLDTAPALPAQSATPSSVPTIRLPIIQCVVNFYEITLSATKGKLHATNFTIEHAGEGDYFDS